MRNALEKFDMNSLHSENVSSTVASESVWQADTDTGYAQIRRRNTAPKSRKERTGSILAGYSVLTKSMMGSGLFFTAYACSQFGIIAAVVMICLAAFVTWVSLNALSILAVESIESEPSFYSLSRVIIPKYSWLIDVALITCCLGASTGYVIIVGSLLSSGLLAIINWDTNSFSLDSAQLVIQCGMVAGLAPLCLMKELSGTKVVNLIGLLCLVYILPASFAYCDLSESSTDLLYMHNFLSAMGTFPTFIFAFACHMNVFQVINELKSPTVKRLNIISLSSTITGLIIYLPIMILPFLTFGNGISQNYLNSLDSSKVPVQIAYILAALSVSISYVLQIHPVRRSILGMYYGDRIPSGSEERRNRILVVVVLLLLTLGVAIGVKSIDVVTNFTGLLGGNTMCFLMPSVLYLKRFGFGRDRFTYMVVFVLAFSILLYPLCLCGIIYGMVD